MQSFDDLEKKLLDQHHVEYKAFTRLLLSLSVASLTLLAALLPIIGSGNIFGSLCLFFMLISVASGVVVQHQIMMAPKQHLNHAADAFNSRQSAEQEQPLKIRRLPSKLQFRLYKLQIVSFSVAFVFLSVYALLALSAAQQSAAGDAQSAVALWVPSVAYGHSGTPELWR